MNKLRIKTEQLEKAAKTNKADCIFEIDDSVFETEEDSEFVKRTKSDIEELIDDEHLSDDFKLGMLKQWHETCLTFADIELKSDHDCIREMAKDSKKAAEFVMNAIENYSK